MTRARKKKETWRSTEKKKKRSKYLSLSLSHFDLDAAQTFRCRFDILCIPERPFHVDGALERVGVGKIPKRNKETRQNKRGVTVSIFFFGHHRSLYPEKSFSSCFFFFSFDSPPLAPPIYFLFSPHVLTRAFSFISLTYSKKKISFNEREYRYVAEQVWTFERSFDVAPETLKETAVDLVITGLDTVADVLLNGEKIARCENAHR